VPEDVQLTVFRLMLGGLVTYSSRTASVMFDGRRRRLVAVVDRSTPRRSARICAAGLCCIWQLAQLAAWSESTIESGLISAFSSLG
jgi:hypothetical protein